MIFKPKETFVSSLKKACSFLKDHFPESIAYKETYEIASFVFKKTKEQLIIDSNKNISPSESETLFRLLKKRSQKYPLAYLLETEEFCGLRFKTGPGVFIPRPETELLVEFGLDFLRRMHRKASKVLCCDLGAGTGCISLSIAKNFPSSFFYAVESSQEAFFYLEENIRRLELKDRIKPLLMTCEEFFHTFSQNFDLVVSNPPYLDKNDIHIDQEVKDYEPHKALWSEDKGLFFLKTWSKKAGENLIQPQGLLALEIGQDQRPDLESSLLSQNLWSCLQFHKDLQGRERIATCYKSF